jgi:hypothetical protein
MNTLYDITTKLREELQANVLINKVTFGDITDIDLNKQTIFPLAHVMLENSTIGERTITVGLSIMLMDIVDESKAEETDEFIGNDNEHDVLNSMLAAGTKTVQEFMRGSSYADNYHMVGDAEVEFFTDRFENKLAGVVINFSVEIPNIAGLC